MLLHSTLPPISRLRSTPHCPPRLLSALPPIVNSPPHTRIRLRSHPSITMTPLRTLRAQRYTKPQPMAHQHQPHYLTAPSLTPMNLPWKHTTTGRTGHLLTRLTTILPLQRRLLHHLPVNLLHHRNPRSLKISLALLAKMSTA